MVHSTLTRLILPHGMVREIARVLNISERTVYTAVNGQITGKKSAAARRLAELKLKEFEQEDKGYIVADK